MKLGITGLSGSGKSTLFDALTQRISPAVTRGENRIGTIKVPDPRVDNLSKMYAPQKTIYAQVEYFLPGLQSGHGETKDKQERGVLNALRDCDALIHVLRNFKGFGLEVPDPFADFNEINQELILADLVVVEKRLERLKLERQRGRKFNPEEMDLLQECRQHLENERPLRLFDHLATAPPLKGFALLSAKPMLVLFNNDDDDESIPTADGGFKEAGVVVRGQIERELAQMAADEAEEFLREFNITASAMDRVIKKSYDLMGLISFFTVGDDEVRAWTIRSGTRADDAAGTIHTDMKKGFIRAEVVACEDLTAAGSYSEARKKGTVRLEGKTYIVKDGDVMTVRFNI